MRSVWSGSLAFGLVSIPVRLYPATEPKDVRFHLVDPETGRRIRYRRVVESEPGADGVGPQAEDVGSDAPDATAGEGPADRDEHPTSGTTPAENEIEFQQLDRGYEVSPGEQVILSAEEIARVRPQRSRTIDIEDFVELASIDPVYFEKSYVLAPERGGMADKPYALLRGALERTGRVGIGRFVLRTKPHLVAIRPRAGVLSLETLFFGDEIRDLSSLASGPSVRTGSRELRLAEELITMLAAEWNPDAYADRYREELLSLIASKSPSPAAPVVERPAPAGASPAEALMDALRRSVEEAKARRAQPGSEDTSDVG